MDVSELIPILLATTAQTQIQGIMNRVYEIVISISAIVIALLWIPIAIGFFSSDEGRKMQAKTRFKNAVIGTLIYILAVSGVLYTVFSYVVNG